VTRSEVVDNGLIRLVSSSIWISEFGFLDLLHIFSVNVEIHTLEVIIDHDNVFVVGIRLRVVTNREDASENQ